MSKHWVIYAFLWFIDCNTNYNKKILFFILLLFLLKGWTIDHVFIDNFNKKKINLDDGLKDNILYVSADPRENEKHEAAVYAAVNKKDPMGNNNSNVYAEVKKIGIKDVKEGAIYSDVKPKKGTVLWFLKIWITNFHLTLLK